MDSKDPPKSKSSAVISERIERLLRDVNANPVVVRWARSSLGRRVESHPLLALFMLLVAVLSAPAVLLFIGAVAVYLTLSTAGFLLLQVCVLMVGCSILLFVLSGVGAMALGLTLAFAPVFLLASLLSRNPVGECRPPAPLTNGAHGQCRSDTRRNSLG